MPWADPRRGCSRRSLRRVGCLPRGSPDAGAPQGRQVGARAECTAEVVGHRADVRAFRAGDPEVDPGHLDGGDLKTGDGDGPGRDLDLGALAGVEVGALAVDVQCAVKGRPLEQFSGEMFLCRFPDQFRGDVPGGKTVRYFRLRIERRSTGPQGETSGVFLFPPLVCVGIFRFRPHAYHQQAGSQRIERAGMAYLEVFYSEGLLERVADLVHHIERSPFQRFVHQKDVSCAQLFERHGSFIAPTGCCFFLLRGSLRCTTRRTSRSRWRCARRCRGVVRG